MTALKSSKSLIKIILTITLFGIFFSFVTNIDTNTVFAGCCNSDSDCGCSGCDAGPDNGQYEWAPGDCKSGQNTGAGESCEGWVGDCGSGSCGYHSSCCGSCDDDDDDDDPTYMDIGGHVIDSLNNAGVSGVTVRICGSSGGCVSEITNGSGFFRNDSFVEEPLNSFQVTVDNTTIPSNYFGPATTTYQPNSTSMQNTHMHSSCGGGNTAFGSTNGYQCQTWDEGNSCAQSSDGNYHRCNFAVLSLGQASNLSVNTTCQITGPDIYNQGVFTWNKAIGASSYILRVDYNDGAWNTTNSGSDWIVSVLSSSAACSNPNTCTVVLPTNYLTKTFKAGNYASWSVEAFNSSGGSSGQVVATPPGFVADSCTPYSITGDIQEVLVESGNTCVYQRPLNSTGNISSMTPEFTTSYNFNRTGTVDTIASTYTINEVPGDPGVVKLLPNSIPYDDPDLAAAGVRYNAACIQTNGTYTYQPNLAEINVGVHTNLADHNFGYVLDNPFSDGWFASLDGDTYGTVIDANVPNATLGGAEPYLTFHSPNSSVAVFGDIVNVSNQRLVEDGKFIKNFTGDFWPNTFSFDPPEDAIEIASPSTFNTPDALQTGSTYYASVDLVNTLTATGGTYDLGGSSGVTTIYVLDDSESNLTFGGENLRSQEQDKKILFVSKPPVVISADMGVALENVGNLVTDRADLEIALIARRTITFESVYDENTPGQIDKIVVVEGPFVAGSSDEVDVNIEFRRNLGVYNAVYPAALVRYNPLYMNSLTENSGVMETDVVWQVSP